MQATRILSGNCFLTAEVVARSFEGECAKSRKTVVFPFSASISPIHAPRARCQEHPSCPPNQYQSRHRQLFCHNAIFPDAVMNSIQNYHCVHALKGSFLPFPNHRQQLVAPVVGQRFWKLDADRQRLCGHVLHARVARASDPHGQRFRLNDRRRAAAHEPGGRRFEDRFRRPRP